MNSIAYPEKRRWNELKTACKERAGWQCEHTYSRLPIRIVAVTVGRKMAVKKGKKLLLKSLLKACERADFRGWKTYNAVLRHECLTLFNGRFSATRECYYSYRMCCSSMV